MLYREPYIIPADLFENGSVTPTAKLIWGFISKFDKKGELFNKKLAAFLGISPRALIKFKRHLASHGYLEKHTENGQIRYLPLNPALKTQKRIELFLKITKFFKNIPPNDLLSMLNEDASRLLFTLEVLEWTYSKSEKPIKYPERLLKTTFKMGVTPDSDYAPGFWEREIDRKAALKASKEVKKAEKQAEKEDLKIREMYEEWLNHATEAEIKKLRELAERSLNGDAPKDDSLRELAVKIKMEEIWEE